MKFDICLMNPPYDKSLHLKFLEKAIQISNNVVSIQPIRWLQDPDVQKHKKNFVNSIGNNIVSLDVVPENEASKLFNARLSFDLGIYVCKNNPSSKTFDIDIFSHTIDNVYVKDILDKIEKYAPNYLKNVVEENKLDGWREKVDFIRPLPQFDPRRGKSYDVPWKGAYRYVFSHSYIFYNGKRDGKWWSEIGVKNQYTKAPGEPIPLSIKFNTETETRNFENSLSTVFMQFIKRSYQRGGVNVPLVHIPFMNDYTKPWTDDRFKKYFKLTKEEWNNIENIMKPYII